MGLDVYVGPFSRYYAGEWETIVQQAARANGMTVQVVRPTAPRRGVFSRLLSLFQPKPDAVADVIRWQADVSRRTGIQVAWDDSPEREYFTDKPAWDCYGALLIWAAYQEHGATKYPATSEEWSDDPILQVAMGDLESKYNHLLANTEIWLPSDIAVPREVPTLGGAPAVIGSVPRLNEQLRRLNTATWSASPEQISEWRRDGAEHGAPLEVSARFGFAIFSELTELAVQHRLPMKLDY